MQMADEQVIGLPDGVPIELRVVGERKPRAEVGRVHPRIGEDAAVGGLDQHAGVAQSGHSHACHGNGWSVSSSDHTSMSCRTPATGNALRSTPSRVMPSRRATAMLRSLLGVQCHSTRWMPRSNAHAIMYRTVVVMSPRPCASGASQTPSSAIPNGTSNT